MKKFVIILSFLIFVINISVAQTIKTGDITFKKPKNIIIMIGDGMGFNHILSANYYTGGKDKLQQYENFPVRLAMSTYPASMANKPEAKEKMASGYSPTLAWNNLESLKDYYTDSGAAATTMSTGKKTYIGAIGVNIEGREGMHISEAAKERGKSIGVVTSVEISHATPAGFSVHNIARKNYLEISREQILESKLDVLMGAGNPDYDNDGKIKTDKKDYHFTGGEEIWNALKNDSKEYIVDGKKVTPSDTDGDKKPDYWSFIQTKEDFEKLTKGKTPKRVLGIPGVFETLQQKRSGSSKEVYGDKLTETVPSLNVMARGALNVLDNNKKGFFLMIEGGAIDFAAHENQLNRVIEEQISFNKTVDAVIEWVEKNSNWNETLLIVTADHETGLIWGENSTGNVFNPLVNNGAGKLPGAKFYSTSHSNSLVPFFAKGAGAEIFNLFADEFDPVRGNFINNPEIAQACFLLMAF